MKLFAFGLGYCAQDFIARFGDLFDRISGTVRSADKAKELASETVEVFVFGPDREDPGITEKMLAADVLLISIPPGVSVDPVLARYGQKIASLRTPQIIVYLSTIGVYGDRQGEWVDESGVPTPTSQRSKTRLNAEKSWAAIGRSRDKTVHILRLAGIYGPGRNALLNLKEGRAHRLIKPDQVFNRVHVEDISRAIAAAIAHEGPGGVWNVSDDAPSPPQDVVAYAASLMGIEPPPEQAIEEAQDISPMTRSFYAENKRASNRKLKEELHVDLAFPTYRVGLEALWEAGEGR
ncbi:NAD-dependent epimerase/dehydratase [Methylocella silvestris BL2]|uniref:NAD-dependent epimerase/dehydratase n=1 Tax=Methylocella silvestris (strain DSM 15510 / CIP 108128 / LMG 27833 / NCIMB 13906 / BL2) TaxID=395965 RepID=B8EJ75_METSB|nr:SDR family oxidoreductase [Methylocella silvestris]ACK52567.1 NAD-dependent epimerase/dehydratase [Methylocella silvestris BL2]